MWFIEWGETNYSPQETLLRIALYTEQQEKCLTKANTSQELIFSKLKYVGLMQDSAQIQYEY